MNSHLVPGRRRELPPAAAVAAADERPAGVALAGVVSLGAGAHHGLGLEVGAVGAGTGWKSGFVVGLNSHWGGTKIKVIISLGLLPEIRVHSLFIYSCMQTSC